MEALQIGGMFLLWNKLNTAVWWVLLVILILMFFGVRTYYTALADGSEASVVKFWYQTRSVIFIADILIIVAMYLYYFLS